VFSARVLPAVASFLITPRFPRRVCSFAVSVLFLSLPLPLPPPYRHNSIGGVTSCLISASEMQFCIYAARRSLSLSLSPPLLLLGNLARTFNEFFPHANWRTMPRNRIKIALQRDVLNSTAVCNLNVPLLPARYSNRDKHR